MELGNVSPSGRTALHIYEDIASVKPSRYMWVVFFFLSTFFWKRAVWNNVSPFK